MKKLFTLAVLLAFVCAISARDYELGDEYYSRDFHQDAGASYAFTRGGYLPATLGSGGLVVNGVVYWNNDTVTSNNNPRYVYAFSFNSNSTLWSQDSGGKKK